LTDSIETIHFRDVRKSTRNSMSMFGYCYLLMYRRQFQSERTGQEPGPGNQQHPILQIMLEQKRRTPRSVTRILRGSRESRSGTSFQPWSWNASPQEMPLNSGNDRKRCRNPCPGPMRFSLVGSRGRERSTSQSFPIGLRLPARASGSRIALAARYAGPASEYFHGIISRWSQLKSRQPPPSYRLQTTSAPAARCRFHRRE